MDGRVRWGGTEAAAAVGTPLNGGALLADMLPMEQAEAQRTQ